ncbi:MAG: hypothetical protein ABIH82_05375 [Candidatus Woesearchaeota archaeon]
MVTPELNRFFGKNRRKVVKRSSIASEKLMELVDDYYKTFLNKLELFNELKEGVIKTKARIYNFNDNTYRQISQSEIVQLREELDIFLNKLEIELERIQQFISVEYSEEKDELKCSFGLIEFIDNELSHEKEFQDHDYWQNYKTYLIDTKNFLLSKRGGFGLFHVLASQIALLHDIKRSRKEISEEVVGSVPDFDGLKKTLRILEVEIMRFGEYCRHESELITLPDRNQLYKQFKGDMQALRTLGLLYSERNLHKYNLGMITQKLSFLGKGFYGTKGVGLIHKDGSVDFRFVRGVREKHSEILRVLSKGLPGTKLVGDKIIKAYLMSLPIDEITKVAGFQLQLKMNANNLLEVVNIDYESTILAVQIKKKEIKGEFLTISKRDFDRLNYAVLFSINKDLLNKKAFEITLEKKGTKIIIKDKRIFPFTG